MSGRRIPVIPTIVVIAAVLTMIGLGVWQLGRMDEKAALLARFEESSRDTAVLTAFPLNHELAYLYRRAPFNCSQVVGWTAIAGRSNKDQTGYVHVASCDQEGVYSFDAPRPLDELVVGWSRDPSVVPDWEGGAVVGMIAPGGVKGWRLVLDQPVSGLEPVARPDPADTPNNHLAYAGQWFFFAFTALVIYVLALRRRGR